MNRTIGRPMEILLVEDSLLDARLTIHALRRGGLPHRLTLILDGAEAMEFLLQEGRFALAPRPDLILLDLLLPKKSGLEILADLRRQSIVEWHPRRHFDRRGRRRNPRTSRSFSRRAFSAQAGTLRPVFADDQGIETPLAPRFDPACPGLKPHARSRPVICRDRLS
jgi:CheY-like chemotaxis protein